MTPIRTLVCIALCLIAPRVVYGGWDEAIAAYEREDFRTAYEHLLPLAQAGSTEAATWLGQMFRYGEGVERDERRAFRWFRRAAEDGHPVAQRFLGSLYPRRRHGTRSRASGALVRPRRRQR